MRSNHKIGNEIAPKRMQKEKRDVSIERGKQIEKRKIFGKIGRQRERESERDRETERERD